LRQLQMKTHFIAICTATEHGAADVTGDDGIPPFHRARH
jgi:hypothetical protein